MRADRHRLRLGTLLGVLLAVTILPAGVRADRLDPALETFSLMPVLENGRLKPVDTFARNLLLQLSGRQRVGGRPAVAWLADLLFDPSRVIEDPVLLINDPQVAVALGLEPQPRRRYSLAQVQARQDRLVELFHAASSRPAAERGPVTREILRLFDNVVRVGRLRHVFSFAEPSPDFQLADPNVAAALGLPAAGRPLSFWEVLSRAHRFEALLRDLQAPQTDLTDLSPAQRTAVQWTQQLTQWSRQNRDMPFAVIPTGQLERPWLSPWDLIAQPNRPPALTAELDHWAAAAAAYRDRDPTAFATALAAVETSRSQAGRALPSVATRRLAVERWYHRAQLFGIALAGYLLALAGFGVSLATRRRSAWWYRGSLAALVAGWVPHTVALACRVWIMQRPPVSTLYETFLFVSWVVVVLSLVIEACRERWLGILAGSIGGAVLLAIAARYRLDGDTLGMLAAVLNSNFWLTTHVLSITCGYGIACVAGLVGHLYLLRRWLRPRDHAALAHTERLLLGTLSLGLAMTFLGTHLGGVWADQSWGRFWGWDPKENGALMIVLWLAVLLHARAGRLIGSTGLAAGAVLGTAVVMWAWFGVNLLGIGLHTYGATTGAFYGLIGYYSFEAAFVVLLTGLIWRQNLTDTLESRHVPVD